MPIANTIAITFLNTICWYIVNSWFNNLIQIPKEPNIIPASNSEENPDNFLFIVHTTFIQVFRNSDKSATIVTSQHRSFVLILVISHYNYLNNQSGTFRFRTYPLWLCLLVFLSFPIPRGHLFSIRREWYKESRTTKPIILILWYVSWYQMGRERNQKYHSLNSQGSLSGNFNPSLIFQPNHPPRLFPCQND